MVALAGCFGDAPAPVEEECADAALCDPDYLDEHFCVRNDVRPRIYAPDTEGPDRAADPWVQGDYWEYRLSINGDDGETTKLVYYDIQDSGAHYMVGTPTREEALQHAVISNNPVIGRVHKTLYSPHESGEHADMFNFPLCQGNTWKDRFFGTDFTFTAHHKPVTLPDGSEDPLGFEIVGTGGGSQIIILYSPEAKWFTGIDLDRADGFEVDMRLTDVGTGASGEAFFLRGQKDEAVPIAMTSRSTSNVLERADGKEGPYDSIGVWADIDRSGEAKVELHIIAPDGTDVGCVGFEGNGLDGATDCLAPGRFMEFPYQAGQWTFRLELPLVGSTEAGADIVVASIYDRSGTV